MYAILRLEKSRINQNCNRAKHEICFLKTGFYYFFVHAIKLYFVLIKYSVEDPLNL